MGSARSASTAADDDQDRNDRPMKIGRSMKKTQHHSACASRPWAARGAVANRNLAVDDDPVTRRKALEDDLATVHTRPGLHGRERAVPSSLTT
jgi:hypothetical protein